MKTLIGCRNNFSNPNIDHQHEKFITELKCYLYTSCHFDFKLIELPVNRILHYLDDTEFMTTIKNFESFFENKKIRCIIHVDEELTNIEVTKLKKFTDQFNIDFIIDNNDNIKRVSMTKGSLSYDDIKDKVQNLSDDNLLIESNHCHQSVLKVRTILFGRQKDVQEEWSRYKYLVMSKSQYHYNLLRQMFSQKKVNIEEFYSVIEEVVVIEGSIGQNHNALQHIIGYFRTKTNAIEKNKMQILLHEYQNKTTSLEVVKKYLFNLSLKYKIDYLIDSYYLNL